MSLWLSIIVYGLITPGSIDWGRSFSMQEMQSDVLPNRVKITLMRENGDATISISCECNYKIRLKRGKLFRVDGRGEFNEFVIGYVGYSKTLRTSHFVVYPHTWTDAKCSEDFQAEKRSLVRRSKIKPKPRIQPRIKPKPKPIDTKWISDFEQKIVDQKINPQDYRRYRQLTKSHAPELSSSDYFKCMILQGMSEYWFWLTENDDATWLGKTQETFAQARKFAEGKQVYPFEIAKSRWTANVRRMYSEGKE